MEWQYAIPTVYTASEQNIQAEMLRLVLVELRTYLDRTYFKDDVNILAGINPVGLAQAPTIDPAGEGWLFAGGSIDNVAVIVCQINHDATQGVRNLNPHIHWRKTSNAVGNVTWRLEAKSAPRGGDFGPYVQVGLDVSVPIDTTIDNNTAARSLVTDFGLLELNVALSSLVVFKLTRVASSTDSDTYAADALAISFDYHYEVDSLGSRQLRTK